MLHMIISGHIHINQFKERRALNPQPLGTLTRGVQAPGKHMEPDRVQIFGQLMPNARVTPRDQHRFGAYIEGSFAH